MNISTVDLRWKIATSKKGKINRKCRKYCEIYDERGEIMVSLTYKKIVQTIQSIILHLECIHSGVGAQVHIYVHMRPSICTQSVS